MGEADVGGKHVLGKAPETWVRWLFDDPSLEVKSTLTEEFQFVLRHSDELLLVEGEDRAPFMVLTELQFRRDPKMPLRMRAYAALAEQKYRHPVYPVVLILLPPGEDREVGSYHSEFMGLVAHQDYRLLEAWNMDARDVLDQEVLALLPYVPLMSGADEELILESVSLLRRRDMGEEMEVALALFASFVMDADQVRKIMRWNMVVLRDSPWYQEILQEGRQEGLQKGRQVGLQEGLQEGRQEGQQTGLRQGILRLLKVRFDPGTEIVVTLKDQLQTITDLSVLQDLLVDAAYVEDLESFRAILEKCET